MSKKPNIFNSAAEYSAHFINPDAQLSLFEGEYKPAQAATRFSDMLQDIEDTAPKFISHLIAINQQVLGEKKTLSALQETVLGEDSSEGFKEQIEALSFDQLIQYACFSYSDIVEQIKNDYITSEEILDQWSALNKGSPQIYDFPAFQDYYLKHPLNTRAIPLEKDHGNDSRFAIDGPLFRICVKSPYSAYSKLFSDYKSPKTPETPFRKDLLTDIQRARIACPDQQVYDFIKVASHHNPSSLTRQNSAQNIGAVLEDNRLVAPKKMTGHRVFFQKLTLPTDKSERGSLVELQILPQSIMDANDITHILMDKADDLLNVPAPSLNARFHASFLYNMCSYIHKSCAEDGGFQKLVGEGLDPHETVLNMMLSDQRPDTLSAVITVQNTAQDILKAIKNGQSCEEINEVFLEQIEFAAYKSVANWADAETNIQNLFNQIDDRIHLLIGTDTKISSKDYREASILMEIQGLIHDQAMDTNIFPHLKPPSTKCKGTRELKTMLIKQPGLKEAVEQLVAITQQQTMDIVLGHTPKATPIIYHCLGLVNQELMTQAPDKKALSQALNKSASWYNSQASADSADHESDQYHGIFNRKRNVEFYRNTASRKDAAYDNFIGVQRDIFGNINVAVEFKDGRMKQLDMPSLKDKFAHSFVRLLDPAADMPESIRKDITKRIVNLSFDMIAGPPNSGRASQPHI
jgi:hypothetical protein|tara:strand:+ start:368774 stop:370846 length:2073 start_codon:yes stop_codon:yes gene_type:complete